MIKFWGFLLLLMPIWAWALPAQNVPPETPSFVSANSNPQGAASQHPEFMTSTDIALGASSGVSIKNISSSSITVTGLYIFTLTSNPADCTTATLYDSPGDPFGALWSPQVTMTQDQIEYVGANYLYNMMMLALYDAKVAGYTGGHLYTPGNAEDNNNTWCLWLGVTDQAVGTDGLTSSTGSLEPTNTLVQFITGDPPVSFTNVTCNDATRTCSTTNAISPQPFPHAAS